MLVDAGFEHGYQKAWAGEIGNDGGSANVAVFLFRDASRTSDVLASLQRILSEDVLEKSAETESVDASGLGQESSAIHADGEDEEIAYAWRTRNLVLVVDLLCFNQCDPADHFREVARAYADDVDARAEKVGG